MADGAGLEIGYTGARFGGGGRKRRREAEADAAPVAVVEEPVELPDDEGPVVGYTGARFGGASVKRARRPEPAPAPVAPAAAPAPPQSVEWPLHRPGPAEPDVEPAAAPVPGQAAVRVRPYVFTGGRTRAEIELELETLVSAGPRPPRDHHSVVELCRGPVSVAEVAALMKVPIGVARVVLGDLAAQGAVTVHATGVQDIPDLAFLERVLTGLRRL